MKVLAEELRDALDVNPSLKRLREALVQEKDLDDLLKRVVYEEDDGFNKKRSKKAVETALKAVANVPGWKRTEKVGYIMRGGKPKAEPFTSNKGKPGGGHSMGGYVLFQSKEDKNASIYVNVMFTERWIRVRVGDESEPDFEEKMDFDGYAVYRQNGKDVYLSREGPGGPTFFRYDHYFHAMTKGSWFSTEMKTWSQALLDPKLRAKYS